MAWRVAGTGSHTISALTLRLLKGHEKQPANRLEKKKEALLNLEPGNRIVSLRAFE
jgi:hypothetical protein